MQTDNEEIHLVEESNSDAQFLEMLWSQNVDIENRRIYLFEEITPESVLNVIKGLSILDMSEGDIEIYINSVGGSVPDGYALIDFIPTLRNKVNGVVLGEACSMASLILQACSVRAMTANSVILIHSGHAEASGSADSVKNHADYFRKEQAICLDLYKQRVKVSKRRLKQLLSQDTILDAKLAIKYGFVDKIHQTSYINTKESE